MFMRISQIFQLNKTQYELDFIDVDIGIDTPLFVDPYFLSKRSDAWSIAATRTLRSFFQTLIPLLQKKQISKAEALFLHLNEPNETCLGLSRGIPQGRGVGKIDSEKILQSLLKSKAVQTGLIEDIEDTRIFVDGVDKDKISDMTTNIIKGHLISYTQQQCKLWGIPLQKSVPSGFYWNSQQQDWLNEYTEMLIVGDRKILLIPKAVASFAEKYAAQQYYQHFVLNFLQNEHLSLDSALVQVNVRKDGSRRRFVTKKSIDEQIKQGGVGLSKNWLADFTEKHPEVFAKFKSETYEKINSVSDFDLTQENLGEVVDFLIEQLTIIPSGNEYATQYHRLTVGILELLFYPHLISPVLEREIHQGRKRIDIAFDNAAEEGIFYRLSSQFDLPCQYVYAECKNYSKDINNPELDQLSGRFSVNRGKVGISLSRTIENLPVLLQRCHDTYSDGRGLIIPLTDEDLIEMLKFVKVYDSRSIDEYVTKRVREITHS